MNAVTQFCSWDDVAKRFSAVGAKLRVDDNLDDAQQDILDEASVEVLGYLGLNYPLAGLVLSQQVRFYTRDVACYLASIRRGNPCNKSIEDRYNATIETLKLLMRGSMVLADTAMQKYNAPVLSNLRVRSFPVNETKVVQGTSTGTAAGYPQHVDTFDVIDYSI